MIGGENACSALDLGTWVLPNFLFREEVILWVGAEVRGDSGGQMSNVLLLLLRMEGSFLLCDSSSEFRLEVGALASSQDSAQLELQEPRAGFRLHSQSHFHVVSYLELRGNSRCR
jgi:hypothetical protein